MRVEPLFYSNRASNHTSQTLYFSLFLLRIVSFILATIHSFYHLPVEAHFRTLHEKYLLTGKNLFELTQISLIKLVGSNTIVSYLIVDFCILSFRRLIILAFAHQIPRFIIQFLLLILKFKIDGKELGCLFFTQSSLFDNECLLFCPELLPG